MDNKDWKISGSGATVKLTSPNKTSTAKLAVTVDDQLGEKATKTVNLKSTRLAGAGTSGDPYRAVPLRPNCKTYLKDFPQLAKDGLYRLNVANKTFNACCDMSRHGGGWTLVLQSKDWQPNNNAWCGTGGYQVPTNPAPNSQIFKYTDSLINSIRGGSGIYRLDGDGRNQHFFKAHSYDHNRDTYRFTVAKTYWTSPAFSRSGQTMNIANTSGRGIASGHGSSYLTNHEHSVCHLDTDGAFGRMWVR